MTLFVIREFPEGGEVGAELMRIEADTSADAARIAQNTLDRESAEKGFSVFTAEQSEAIDEHRASRS